MSVLDDVEHRVAHAEAWVAEASGTVVAALTPTCAGQPNSEIAMGDELEFQIYWSLVRPLRTAGVGRAVAGNQRLNALSKELMMSNHLKDSAGAVVAQPYPK